MRPCVPMYSRAQVVADEPKEPACWAAGQRTARVEHRHANLGSRGRQHPARRHRERRGANRRIPKSASRAATITLPAWVHADPLRKASWVWEARARAYEPPQRMPMTTPLGRLVRGQPARRRKPLQVTGTAASRQAARPAARASQTQEAALRHRSPSPNPATSTQSTLSAAPSRHRPARSQAPGWLRRTRATIRRRSATRDRRMRC